MTDTPFHPTDPTDDDLLASLYLDGEATPEERARVEAEPRLMSRVEAFQANAARLSAVTPPPDLGRLQIATALDLFDQQHAAAPEGATSLSAHRARQQSRQHQKSRGIPTWLGAAAAVALVVGGLGFASTLNGSSDDAASDAAMDATDDLAASSTNRSGDEAATAEAAPLAELTEESATDSDAMSETAADDSAGDAVMEGEDDSEEEGDGASSDDAAVPDADAATEPVPLDGLDGSTAADYLELLNDRPLLPIAASPCADSPLVQGMFGVDSFLPVVYNGELASLLVEAGVPSTAVIVGPTCEVQLQ